MIETPSLTRRFGTFTAVSQVSLRVPDGTILALLGPNGAGKTTTVRMLAGLLAPTEGNATIAGYDILRQPDPGPAPGGPGADTPGFVEPVKGSAYLDFFGSIYGMPAAERTRRIDELLEFFDLVEHRNEKMAGFSKGMKQKVALARALMHEPAVLFLDEPTAGLDPLAARAVRELIVGLKHSSRSIILCTHDLDEAERLADEVAIIRQGQIVAHDTPAVLRRQATGETRVRGEFADSCPLALEALAVLPDVHTPRFIRGGNGIETSSPSADGNEPQVLEYTTTLPKVVNPQLLSRWITPGEQAVSSTSETSSLENVSPSAMGDANEYKMTKLTTENGAPV